MEIRYSTDALRGTKNHSKINELKLFHKLFHGIEIGLIFNPKTTKRGLR